VIFLVLHRINDGYIRLCTRLLVVALLVLISAPAFAAQLSFKPSLELSETYTDNVVLLRNSGEEDLITEINPGFALKTEGNRLNANLGLTLQNLFYVKDSSRNARYHDLMADASAELISDFAFLNLRASDSQRAISPSGGLAKDNLNTTDRADISVWLINPHFKNRFGGKAEGAASYSYEEIRNDGLGVSDATIETIQVGLKSGPFFRRMTWSLGYSQEITKRNEASNYSKESSVAEGSYRVYKKLGVLFRAGSERNDLVTSQNGSYYAGGIRIVPHSTFRIDLLSGNRLDEISISWVLTSRSAVDILWRNQKVGQNPGKVWQGTLRLINRRIVWRASYLEETTSVQGLQSSEPSSQSDQSQPGNAFSSECSLSNGLFVRKRAQTDFGYKTAKSLVSVALHGERREFEANFDEKSRGGTVSWRWHFATRTTMLLSFHGSKNECSGSGRSRDTELSFSRKMGLGMEGYAIAQNKSGNGLRSYDENRLSVGVKWHF